MTDELRRRGIAAVRRLAFDYREDILRRFAGDAADAVDAAGALHDTHGTIAAAGLGDGVIAEAAPLATTNEKEATRGRCLMTGVRRTTEVNGLFEGARKTPSVFASTEITQQAHERDVALAMAGNSRGSRMARRLLDSAPSRTIPSEVTAMVLDEGQVLDGKYVIVRVLATGSMGEVYLGRNERIGKEVAVKVLRRDLAEEPAIASRFEREARIATAVKSTHVVDVYDLGDLPTGERFIVMEYVEGESLATRMGKEGKLSARAVGSVALQILDGLSAAHEAGVIHRDLKPANVILTKRDNQETVKLVDFGISKLSEKRADGSRGAASATMNGMLLGTPMYMSPEQARGDSDAVDLRTDIFSLGVTMYEALSGEVPFTADNVVSLLSKVMGETEVPLTERVPNVDPALARIVKKAMSKDPKDRYQTAAEMRDAISEWYTVFGSTSSMRSSLEGVARPSMSITPEDDTQVRRISFSLAIPTVPPAIRAWLPKKLPTLALPKSLPPMLNDHRVRLGAGAAGIAVALLCLAMHHPDPPAQETAAVQVTSFEPQPITVPTVPVQGEQPAFSVPAMPIIVTTATPMLPDAPKRSAPISVKAPAAAPAPVAPPAPIAQARAARTAKVMQATTTATARPAPRVEEDRATRDAGAGAAAIAAVAKADETPAPAPTPPPDPPATP